MPIRRIAGRALQALRKRHLTENPLCVICQAKGKLSRATNLDHVLALVNGGDHSAENFQGLCHACHTEKTRADLGYKPKIEYGIDGWPIENNQGVRGR